MSGNVHLTGNFIVVGHYAIQRCLLCGKSLIEFNASRIASPDGSPLSQLMVGAFYEVTDSRTVFMGEADSAHFDSDLDLPDDCCLRHKPIARD